GRGNKIGWRRFQPGFGIAQTYRRIAPDLGSDQKQGCGLRQEIVAVFKIGERLGAGDWLRLRHSSPGSCGHKNPPREPEELITGACRLSWAVTWPVSGRDLRARMKSWA